MNATNEGKFRLNMIFLVSFILQGEKKQTAKEKQCMYISILYLNLGRHTIVWKTHSTLKVYNRQYFMNSARGNSKRYMYAVIAVFFALTLTQAVHSTQETRILLM